MNLATRAVGRRGQEEPPPAKVRLSSQQAWLLGVCCVAQFMVILDLSIVNVALPSIQTSLNFSAVGLQWVVDAYAIAFAGFLMLGGRATDHYGQRKLFVFALTLFALASLAGGSATTKDMLIAARAAQGLSGALMAASSLAIVTSSFAGQARQRAIGLWGAMNGAGGAAGTLFGGVITESLGWRWVLLINPPIGLIAAAVALKVVNERRKEDTGSSFDLTGATILTCSLVAIVYGVVNAASSSWLAPLAIGPIVGGVALSFVFVYVETHVAKAPLVPFKALTRPVWITNGVVLAFSAALFPMWFVSSLYMQQVLGLSPLDTGLAFLPMALIIMLSAQRAGHLVGRFGVRAVLVSGLAMMLTAMLLFARIEASGNALYYIVLPGLLMALGIGLSVVGSTIAAVQSAGPEKAGLVSGLVNTARQSGGGLGLALLISVGTELTSRLIGENKAAPAALTDGYRLAYLIGAGFVLVALAVAAFLLPRPAPQVSQRCRYLRLPVGVAAVIAAFLAVDLGIAGDAGGPIGAWTATGAYSFVSAPALHPPIIRTISKDPGVSPAPGYIMVGNFYDLTTTPMDGQSGPLLLNNRLQPVWFRPVPDNVVASNLSIQTFEGKPALAWWQGVVTDTGETESGEDVVVNQHYQVVARLKGADGWTITMHSLVIEGDDAWVTANKNIPMNLLKYGGSQDGVLTDSAVQEYNLKTGRLIRNWNALKHIPLSDSHAIPQDNGYPWDAYHVNSISLAPGGSALVVSMRNTWAVYLVSTKTGRIEWELGGKRSSFSFGPGAEFEWQHDVTLDSGSVVTLFDDHCCQISGAGTYVAASGPSRALVLKLNLKSHTAALVAQYTHGSSFDAAYMGSVQLLPGGKVLVGWGAQPEFSEYTKSGKLIFDARFPGPDLSYRAISLPHWVGLPLTKPSAAARRSGGKTTVYASWNGATRVTAWRVLAGPDAADMRVLAEKAKSGFETAIPVSGSARFLKVEALDSHGTVIGVSRAFAPRRGAT